MVIICRFLSSFVLSLEYYQFQCESWEKRLDLSFVRKWFNISHQRKYTVLFFYTEQETRQRAEEQNLEVHLSRRRDELRKYRFGDKIRLDSFRGLSIEDVTRLRIGCFGPTGVGISSFIYTCERVVRQAERGTAMIYSGGFQGPLILQDYLPEMFFRLVDISGYFSSEPCYVEVQDILFGKLQPGDKISRHSLEKQVEDKAYQCSPCAVFGDRMHGVICVFKANDVRLAAGALDADWKSFRGLLRKIGRSIICCYCY